MTIRAMTPTSSNCPRIADISLILNAATTTLAIYSDIIATKMLIAEEPLIQRNTTYIIRATRIMSSTSINDRFRNPKIANSIAPIFIFDKDNEKPRAEQIK